MLRQLRIHNFAIIDTMELDLASGMNVLTGETGAGKSIITKAIVLLCGGRASAELIRSDCDEAEIEGLFDLASSAPLLACGLAANDELLVRRVIQRNGKGRIYINGSLSSASVLAQLGDRLIHVYGQHEHALLLKPESHLELVDDFAKLTAERSQMAASFERYRALAEHWRRLTADRDAVRERLELLRYQVDELSKTNPHAGEEEELKQERERQRHAERLQQTCLQSETALYSADDSLSSGLARVILQLQEAARIDVAFTASLESLRQAAAQVDDAALELRRLGEHIERDPERLDQIEERLTLLARLKRKYDCDADGLVDRLAALQSELHSLEQGSNDPETLRAELHEAHQQAWVVARALTQARERASRALAKRMATELKSLGMEGTVFKVVFAAGAPAPSSDGDAFLRNDRLSATGADSLEFYLSANPGEEPRPLAKVASGGELSRIMLALKALTAGEGEVETLIFDEVDTGIGGTVAEAVGKRLHELAARRQLLSITHLPQIAALADHHLAVDKQVRQGRTASRARVLRGDERVDEIARMLGAAGSEESRRYALRLLAGADPEAKGPDLIAKAT